MKNQKQVNQSIHIYRQGRKTIAQLNQGKEIINMSSAICHPDDEYDFTIGSKIAYERLMNKTVGKDIKTKVGNKVGNLLVMEVKRPAKTGEYIRALKNSEHYRYKNDDILLVTDGDLKHPWNDRAVCYYSNFYKDFVIKNEDYVVLENYKGNKTFRPLLIPTYNGKPSGISVDGEIGDDTSLVDIFGNKLKVGDTVLMYRANSGEIECVVCKNTQKEYIGGYKNFTFEKGLNKQYRSFIIKKQSYKDIKHKTIINEIMYFTEDKEV